MELKKNEILVLRDVKPDMTSRNGFKWPKRGKVKCTDWKADYSCGYGLHGLPWGVGGNYRIGGISAKYLVVKVDTSKDYYHGKGDMIDKCKFKSGVVVFCGERKDAVELISKYAPADSAVNWSTQKAGGGSTQTAGNWSMQTAGNWSTQKAGNWSTQKAGDVSTQKAGNWSTQTAGKNTVQIVHWFDEGIFKVSTRVITKKEADKWYKFENGKWRKCIKTEIDEAERLIAQTDRKKRKAKKVAKKKKGK